MSTSAPSRLLGRVRRALRRDADLPLSQKIRKALRFGVNTATAPLYLLGCDRVGPGARTRGRPVISSAGRIELGARAILGSMYAPVQLCAGPQGAIEVGDDAVLNFGAVISAKRLVRLGDRVRVAPYVVIDDDDGEAGDESGPQPILVGNDVWIASRAHIRKGTVIGDGAVIAAGAEVMGEIPPRVLAGGVPARVIKAIPAAEPARPAEGEEVRRA